MTTCLLKACRYLCAVRDTRTVMQKLDKSTVCNLL